MPRTNRENHMFKEIFTSERVTKTTVAGLGLAAVASIIGFWGESAENIPRTEQEQKLINEASETYNDASITKKYSISFTQPLILKSTEFEQGGHGISKNMNSESSYKRSRVRVGRSCLSETAYDIDKNEYGAAALHVEGDSVSIYPASINAEPLEFSLQTDGVLKPLNGTAETLRAYDCRFLGDIPVRSTFGRPDASFDWDLLDPLMK